MVQRRSGPQSTKTADAKPAEGRTGGRRVERTEATRRALVDATIAIVGQSGYAEASIARITAKAGVAQGTFYNYFSSQQDLFDQMLPLMGQEMLERVRAGRRGAATAPDKERAGFQAFFDYLLDVPQFYRILNEAETFAPRGYRQHIENMATGYVRSLSRARAQGELGDFDERELEVVAYALISTRLYLAMRYTYWDGGVSRIPAWVGDTYMKLLRQGLFDGASGGRSRRSRPPKATEAVEELAARPQPLEVGQDRALVALELRMPGVDPSGRGRRALLAELVETAAALAVEADGLGPFVLLDLSLRLVRPPQDGRLFAQARCLDRGGAIALATVEVRQDQPDGLLLASAQLSFRRQ